MKKSLLLSLIFITVLIVFANSSKLHSKKSRKADKTTTKEKAEKKAEKKADPNYTKYEYPNKDCSQENCYGGKCNDDKSVCYCLKEFSSYEERGDTFVSVVRAWQNEELTIRRERRADNADEKQSETFFAEENCDKRATSKTDGEADDGAADGAGFADETDEPVYGCFHGDGAQSGGERGEEE